VRENLIEITGKQSPPLPEVILGCLTALPWIGRNQQVVDLIADVQSYTSKQNDKSNYLLVFGSPGSGKSRFLAEVGKQIINIDSNYLVLCCTFNHDQNGVSQDSLISPGLNEISLPISTRLLFGYARKGTDYWPAWRKDFEAVKKRYRLDLSLSAVIDILKTKYNKSKAVLLVDETHRLMTMKFQSEDQTKQLMSEVVKIQDHGVAVIFSAFSTNLAQRECADSGRRIIKFPMTELVVDDVKTILNNVKSPTLASLSTVLGLEENQILDLCVGCIGGTPRVIEYIANALTRKNNSLDELLDGIGREVASKYSPPSIRLVLAALGNVDVPPNQTFIIASQSLTLVQLMNFGFCQDNSESPGRAILSYPHLLSAVYSDSTRNLNFNEALKQFLRIPMSRSNIWEEFLRRLLIVRSFNFPKEETQIII
jgi:hypothetical protein